jgi:hypothetical protein
LCAEKLGSPKEENNVDVIGLQLRYYPLVLLAIGVIASLVAIRRLPPPANPARVIEALLAWFVFFNVGVSYLCNFIVHAFFGTTFAQFQGWPDSPFQFEVAAASLGFAATGFVAAFGSLEMRFLAILGACVFELGDVYIRVRQSTVAGSFAPGNVDATTYAVVVILMIGLILLWMQSRLGQPWNQDRRKSPYIR